MQAPPRIPMCLHSACLTHQMRPFSLGKPPCPGSEFALLFLLYWGPLASVESLWEPRSAGQCHVSPRASLARSSLMPRRGAPALAASCSPPPCSQPLLSGLLCPLTQTLFRMGSTTGRSQPSQRGPEYSAGLVKTEVTNAVMSPALSLVGRALDSGICELTLFL